jgi:hypothetical protein
MAAQLPQILPDARESPNDFPPLSAIENYGLRRLGIK